IGLGPAHLPGLFMPNTSLPDNVSMTSTYLPMPILLALCWVPLRRRAMLAPLILLVLSAAMVPGPASPVLRVARALVPPLGCPRLPAADYRVFVALALILLGTAGLRGLRGRRLLASRRWIVAFLLFLWGLLRVFPRPLEEPQALTALACFGLSVAALFL